MLPNAQATKRPSSKMFKPIWGALVQTLWRSVKLTTTPPVLNGDLTEPDNFHVRSLRGVITASAETCHQCTQNCRAECSTFGAMPVPSLRPKTALHCYVAVGLGSGLQTCLAMEIGPPLKRMLYPLQSWVVEFKKNVFPGRNTILHLSKDFNWRQFKTYL